MLSLFVCLVCVGRGWGESGVSVARQTVPSAVATFPPMLGPTTQPTPFPTKFPTGVPSRPPTPISTTSPTARPSPDPSNKPTTMPSPGPTPSPSGAPSLLPTRSPSLQASFLPSAHPSNSPSSTPTITGSSIPTATPSASPSTTASDSPSSSPTRMPTPSPSSVPSQEPSVTGSQRPSSSPSGTPTRFPSASPSRTPTVSPTAVPSGNPTQSQRPSAFPSDSPSRTPSASPSLAPTSLPSHSPTVFPSAEPTSFPTLSLQINLVEVVMFFDNSVLMGDGETIAWQQVTEDHIERDILKADVPNEIMDLRVGVNLVDQELVANADGSRRLQSTPLKIIFNTRVSFRSLSSDLDVSQLIGDAFNSDSDRTQYLDDLQQQGYRTFTTINSMRVEINGIPQVEKIPPQPPSESINIFVIIGAAAAGVAVAILIALLYFRKASPVKHNRTVSTPSTAQQTQERMNTEILVEPQDEVSTLGDPTYAGAGMVLGGIEKDETVTTPSIVSGDYDYAKHYRLGMTRSVSGSGRTPTLSQMGSVDGSIREGSSSADFSSFGLGKMDHSLFSDDSSFEQQFVDFEGRFEIVAPTGKLGMVIDTPSGGVPIVHAIKETSVLADRVQVGDRLMSVDDEDTTGMTAMQVSRLISLKADNPSRVLVFSRTRNRTATEDILGA
eukprot:CAMPEP_0116863510 /NCGR_PEP_ID=MMETSP0418-20121206/24271_1 /TAXON_ID=1158023 /ORGANISM="Astrosyne radiata, Strain 13vi08-1A" /LENGTH=666 /DNA_ID=CAMNT_0004498557 /DNA_START=19 /DNA_END=2019 /DNA_ORIENTATION=-